MAPPVEVPRLQCLAEYVLRFIVLKFSQQHVSNYCICIGNSIRCRDVATVKRYIFLPEVLLQSLFNQVEELTRGEQAEGVRSIAFKIFEPINITPMFMFQQPFDSYYLFRCQELVTLLRVDGEQLVGYELQEPEFPKYCLLPLVNLVRLEIMILDKHHSVFEIIGQQCRTLKILHIWGKERSGSNPSKLLGLFFTNYETRITQTRLCDTLQEFYGLFIPRLTNTYALYFFLYMRKLRVLNSEISLSNLSFLGNEPYRNMKFLTVWYECENEQAAHQAFRLFPSLDHLALSSSNSETSPMIFNSLSHYLPHLTQIHLRIQLTHREGLFRYLQAHGKKLKLLCIDVNHDYHLPIHPSDLFDFSDIASLCPKLEKFYWLNYKSNAVVCSKVVKLQKLSSCAITLSRTCHESDYMNLLKSISEVELLTIKSLGALTDSDIDRLLKGYPFHNLIKFCFYRANFLTEQAIKNIVYKCPKLTVLESTFRFIQDRTVMFTLVDEFISRNLNIHLHEIPLESIKRTWKCI